MELERCYPRDQGARDADGWIVGAKEFSRAIWRLFKKSQ